MIFFSSLCCIGGSGGGCRSGRACCWLYVFGVADAVSDVSDVFLLLSLLSLLSLIALLLLACVARICIHVILAAETLLP